MLFPRLPVADYLISLTPRLSKHETLCVCARLDTLRRALAMKSGLFVWPFARISDISGQQVLSVTNPEESARVGLSRPVFEHGAVCADLC